MPEHGRRPLLARIAGQKANNPAPPARIGQTVDVRVFRCFAFVDMCGFTRMNDTLGDDEALAVLAEFRAIVRGLSPDHGIRVGKWLGDGCMFVGTEVRPVVETVLDLTERMESASIVLPLRIGIAAGRVIVFEGDDFIGMSINLASRLCDAAAPGEILANDEVIAALGDAFPVISLGERQIPGIVSPIPVWRVAAPEVEDELPLSFVE
jgi:adenylate cyclase